MYKKRTKIKAAIAAKAPAIKKLLKPDVGIEVLPHLDNKRLLFEHSHSDYKVSYAVYHEDGPEIGETTLDDLLKSKTSRVPAKDHACFSRFRTMYEEFEREYGKKPNRVLYRCDHDLHHHKECHTTEEERVWWVNACKKHKLMPSYIGKHFLKTKNFIVSLNGITMNRLYVYLCSARYIQEEPFFVKNMYHLVNDNHLDFFVAFVAASGMCITNSGHHIIDTSRRYPFPQSIESFASNILDFGEAVGLRKLLNGGAEKVQTKKIREAGGLIAYGTQESIRVLNNALSQGGLSREKFKSTLKSITPEFVDFLYTCDKDHGKKPNTNRKEKHNVR